MKKFLSVLITAILIVFAFGGCEKDDICVDAVTPQLIIRFYDNTDINSTLNVTQLRVIGVGMDDAIIDRVTTDSIAIPLKTLENNTSFVFITNSDEDDNGNEVGNADTLTFNYIRNELYVSRACGYKVNYSELSDYLAPDDDNWIHNVIIENSEVVDENTAHVYIYH